MSSFYLYFKLGFSHIADFAGYDHILFIVTLCAVYTLKEWKSVLVLVTAFTVGHSLTLALATLKILIISSDLIEFLIPLTIFLTAIANIIIRNPDFSAGLHMLKYATALFFGLIHGLGFSNYLRSLLGAESSLLKPLLAFNLGLEIGQIAIVAGILSISLLLLNFVHVIRREWNLVISGAGLGIALILMIERFFILLA
ncbi:MAG: HupE / UreJ protein [Bacteroidia bacterium]|nr:MAG: HupE / UreJ protein [Bacteroidia bacterium]